MPVRTVCKPHSPDLKRGALATDARGCSLWRSLLERPPPAPESRVRDPLGEWVRTRVGGVTCAYRFVSCFPPFTFQTLAFPLESLRLLTESLKYKFSFRHQISRSEKSDVKLLGSNKHQTNNAFKGNLETGHKRGKNSSSEMNCFLHPGWLT